MASKTVLQKEKEAEFRRLHQGPALLVLPNAWDVASAKIFQHEGAKAIATTSAGVAQAVGYADGQRIPKELLVDTVGRIISSVSVPVSIDLEAGFGSTPSEVADTVWKVLQLGAVGLNLEDLDPATEKLIPLPEQVARIEMIRHLEAPCFINARTDVYLSPSYAKWSPEQKYEETLKRLLAFKAAGADGLFVPGLTDLNVIRCLTSATQLPFNVLGGDWIQSLEALKDAGVARVSVGSGIFRAALTHAQLSYRAIAGPGDGQFSCLKGNLGYDEINNLYK